MLHGLLVDDKSLRSKLDLLVVVGLRDERRCGTVDWF
jgi:hypothetical protein